MHKITIKILMLAIIAIYIAFPYFTVPFNNNLHLYLINPLMWGGLSIGTYFLLTKRSKKFNFEKFDIRNLVLVGSLSFIIVYFASGIMLGFSNSPYNRSLTGFLKNFWIFILVPLLHEIVREGLISSIKKKDRIFFLITVTLFFAIVELGLINFSEIFNSRKDIVDFILSDFALALVSSSFLTYLSYKEGFISALLYKLPIAIAFIATPVFPQNADVLLTILSIVVPIATYLKIENLSDYKTVFEKQEKIKFGERVLNIIYLSFILFLGLFSLGLLPYYPVVILSDSMAPDIRRGDIVIGRKAKMENVDIDDIIVYKLDETRVIHRIKELKYKVGNTYLITQGDNNRTPDPRLVTNNQVEAKVYFTIPKLGYPTILVREFLFGHDKKIDIQRGDL